MSLKDKSTWNVFFHTFLTHIRHDIQKGVDNQKYNWHNVQIERQGKRIKVFQNKVLQVELGLDTLGTESAHSEDNQVFNWLSSDTLKVKAQIKQSNLTTSQETIKMNEAQKNEIAAKAKSLLGDFQTAGATALKMESGEALLKAVENLILQRAGFFGKVKFKFAPELLDLATAAGVSVIVAEYLPNNKAAVISAEAMRLATMKRITSQLPIVQITNAITQGGAVESLKQMVGGDE